MKRQSKKIIFIIFVLFIITIPEMASATKYIICGNNKSFPYVFADLVSKFITLIKIAVPILLVVSGMISFLKVTFSSNVEEDLKKAKSKLINSIIAAVVIFFVISIVNFAVSLVAGTNNQFMNCINCFINPEKCNVEERSDDEELKPGFINQNGQSNSNNNQTSNTNNTQASNTNNQNNTTNNQTNMQNTTGQIVTENGVTYIDGVLIVNKTYSLPSDYAPASSQGEYACNECLTTETLSAFNEMKADATAASLNLYISSGYRSFNKQTDTYNRYVSQDGVEMADTYSARPGHSEHQTGLAFDLNTINDSFATTAEGKWVNNNCHKYGFILRYPQNKQDITGYKYESWHLRYVGKELAEKLYNNGNWITLEEYFNITSSYQ